MKLVKRPSYITYTRKEEKMMNEAMRSEADSLIKYFGWIGEKYLSSSRPKFSMRDIVLSILLSNLIKLIY